MIWYYLQHHGDATGIDWLLDRLSHARSFVECSIDLPVPGQIERLQASGRERFICRESQPIVWAGPSLVTSFVAAIERALASSVPWEHFINVSGSCVPLRSQEQIHASLATLHDMGLRVFVFGYPSPAAAHIEEVGPANYGHIHKARLPIRMTDAVFAVAGAAQNEPTSPIQNAGLRLAVKVAEQSAPRELFVRGLTSAEAAHRKALFQTHRPHTGRAWYILHRSFCEWLVEAVAGEFREIYDELLTTFIADETILPTIVYGGVSGWDRAATTANFRAGLGEPLQVGKIPPVELLEGKGFFARKLWLNETAYRTAFDAALRTAPIA